MFFNCSMKGDFFFNNWERRRDSLSLFFFCISSLIFLSIAIF